MIRLSMLIRLTSVIDLLVKAKKTNQSRGLFFYLSSLRTTYPFFFSKNMIGY